MKTLYLTISLLLLAFASSCSTSNGGAGITNVTPSQAQSLLGKDGAPQVIDLRTQEEFKEGHISGAQVVDVKKEDYEKQLQKLDPNQPYLIHCRSGGRSTKALPSFEKLGFKKIYHLDKGFNSWKEAGLPVSKK